MLSDRDATREILTALGKAGYAPRFVDYGDGEGVEVSTVDDAVDEVMSVDEAFVVVGTITGSMGWVRFVLGNGDPLDLVADHTLSLSEVIDPIMHGWGL